MTIEQNIFKCAEFNFEKIKKYGFILSGSVYVYKQRFMNDEFEAQITITPDGKITGLVYDTANNDIYLPLRIEGLNVGFVGQVKTAYKKILFDIKNHCCTIYPFAFAQSKRIARFILETFGDMPDFPWKKDERYGVFRHPQSKKWYGLIMNIDKNKLNSQQSGEIEIINLKTDEQKIPSLIKQKGFYPAYHMNKKYWLTVTLDDTLDDKIIQTLIIESHAYSEPKTK